MQEDYSPEVFKSAGGFRHKNTIIYPPSVLINLKQFNILEGVQIDAFTYILGGTGITLKERTHIASGVSVGGGGKLETGWCCSLSAGVKIVTGTDLPMKGLGGACIPNEFRTVKRSFVIIKDLSMIFTNSTILPGVTIGEGAIVGANSLVNKDLEPWGVYVGNPVKKIKTRDKNIVLDIAHKMKEKYGY